MSNGPYVEDSTKGKAVPNPQTYKRDVLMQVWLESRHLATLLRWLDRSGIFVRFRSEVVKITLEQVIGHLVEMGEAEMVEFSDEARTMLDGRFGADSNPKGKGLRNKDHNLVLDERRRERMDGSTSMRFDKTLAKSTSEPAMAERIADGLRQHDQQTREEEDKRNKESLSKIDFDEHGIAKLDGSRTQEEIEADRREKDEKSDRKFKEGYDDVSEATFNNNTKEEE